MQKGRAFQPDVDECRLHARQRAHDLALVDVRDDAEVAAALDMHLLQHPVLHNGDACFLRRDVDQNLLAHRQSTPAFFISLRVSNNGSPTIPE